MVAAQRRQCSPLLSDENDVMAIYELHESGIKRLQKTTFAGQGIRERQDIQRMLREQIEIISEGTMVIAEEFGHWDASRRRIDLLCIDKDADPPPLNGSTLKYGFDHEGGSQWQRSDTSPTRSSRSFGRLRF